jgi:hypothetical protein
LEARAHLRACVGCAAMVPDIDGPTHRYIGASPGCWALYGELAEKEAGDFRYVRSHQLTVDAYCAQHPGVPSPQAVRWLEVPAFLRAVTVLDLLAAKDPAEHARRARGWAESVWEAWMAHHEVVRRWAVHPAR